MINLFLCTDLVRLKNYLLCLRLTALPPEIGGDTACGAKPSGGGFEVVHNSTHSGKILKIYKKFRGGGSRFLVSSLNDFCRLIYI